MRETVQDWMAPDYTEIWKERSWLLDKVRDKGDVGIIGARLYYKTHPVEAIEDMICTLDPRKEGSQSVCPFILTPRQQELIYWLWDRLKNKEFGCIEKSREVGASWVCLAFAWWLWTFHPYSHIGFGSQIERKVDRIGDMSALLPKLRFLMKWLPIEFLPPGYTERDHAPFMRLLNPVNGSQIIGEAGDSIGRGSRGTIYFVDEAAFIEHPEAVDAALSETAPTIIYLSTPNGTGNPFYRKVKGGDIPVFTFHWRQDPRKDEAWYAMKKKTLEPEILAAEVDLDYEASNINSVIRAEWITSSKMLRTRLEKDGNLPCQKEEKLAGLDVADGGGASSVFVPRQGAVVGEPIAWTIGDVIDTAKKADALAKERDILTIMFDSIGVGRGTAAQFRRMNVNAKPINVGRRCTKTKWPDGKRAHEKFVNLKAELWWIVRDALWRTHQHWLYVESDGVNGIKHDVATLLLLPENIPLGIELAHPRYTKTESGKIQIESKKQMAARGVKSPDHAEALVLTYTPKPVGVRGGRTTGHY